MAEAAPALIRLGAALFNEYDPERRGLVSAENFSKAWARLGDRVRDHLVTDAGITGDQVPYCNLSGMLVAEDIESKPVKGGGPADGPAGIPADVMHEVLVPQDPQRPFGLPRKEGVQRTTAEVWRQILLFITEYKWYHETPANPDDLNDPLLARKLPYGAFMLGFDFHLTDDGPKLIEINTNAGGLATVFSLTAWSCEKEVVRGKFFEALMNEWQAAVDDGAVSLPAAAAVGGPCCGPTVVEPPVAAVDPARAGGGGGCGCSGSPAMTAPNEANGRPSSRPTYVAIVDTDVKNQGLYMEMLYFAMVLDTRGVRAGVFSPQELTLTDSGLVDPRGDHVDMVYNRLVDFRLQAPEHAHLRQASLAKQVVITPHPASYVRIADKRLLSLIEHPVVPRTMSLSDRPMEEWAKERKRWVFKPPEGAGSKGVYRGDKLSVSKLGQLPPDTVAQEYCPPGVSDDGSKYDLRVFTRNATVLGLATRHFTGQVMEMSSEKSGFRIGLPDNVCCFPML